VATNKQRREASRRQLQRQLERRQVQDERRKRFTLIASVAGTIVLVAAIVVAVVFLGSGSDHMKNGAAAGSTSPTSSPSPTKIPGICDFLAAGTAAKKNNPPSSAADTKGTVTVTAKTNRGDLVLKLDRSAAPCTVSSFVSLVKQKFFDNTTCHRLVTSGIYVLQCGDPTAKGAGGPGYSIPDEATGAEKYPAGTIAMARAPNQPHSGGSQFFIVYKDSPALEQNLGQQQYTVFGTVTKGLDIIKDIAAKGSDNSNAQGDGKPKQPVEFLSMTVTSSTTK
jgi:peptidyl-prolyl cis-trans isomerase B (cyclophilin B)